MCVCCFKKCFQSETFLLLLLLSLFCTFDVFITTIYLERFPVISLDAVALLGSHSILLTQRLLLLLELRRTLRGKDAAAGGAISKEARLADAGLLAGELALRVHLLQSDIFIKKERKLLLLKVLAQVKE